MTIIQTIHPNSMALCVDKSWVHSDEVRALAQCSKSPIHSPNQIYIATFNIRKLSPIKGLPELTVSTAKQNKDIISVQEHWYHHRELKLKYLHTRNGWKNYMEKFFNVAIGNLGKLLSPHALKSLNSIEKIQSHLMATSAQQSTLETVTPKMKPTSLFSITSCDLLSPIFPNTTF